MAKPCACDTRQGLCVRGCGTHLVGSIRSAGSEKALWLAEVVLGWPAVDGESPVRESLCGVVVECPE